MNHPSLGLLVLRTAKMEASLAFFRAIGLVLTEEQHGSGPVHYSCSIGDTVLEIYPGEAGNAPDRKSGGATMIGIVVSSVDASLSKLADQKMTIISPPKDSAWGRRAVVLDPDGRAIELSEPKA
jgi:predicted enzyme related to lactoylglutathione lyase